MPHSKFFLKIRTNDSGYMASLMHEPSKTSVLMSQSLK